MTTKQSVTKTVHATSASRGMWKDKPNISLVIPSFESDYPIVVNEWPDGFRDSLSDGQPLDVILERQSLKQGKDGTKDWHYWWAIKSVAGSREPAAATLVTPPPQASPPAQEQPYADRDHTRTSIERQKSLDIAEQFYSRFAPGGSYGEEITLNEHSARLLAVAQRFALWIATGQVPIVASRPAGAAPTGQSGDPMPGDDKPPF